MGFNVILLSVACKIIFKPQRILVFNRQCFVSAQAVTKVFVLCSSMFVIEAIIRLVHGAPGRQHGYQTSSLNFFFASLALNKLLMLFWRLLILISLAEMMFALFFIVSTLILI